MTDPSSHLSFRALLCWACVAATAATAVGQTPELSTHLPLRQILIGEDSALNIQSTEKATGPLKTLEESELTFRDLGTDFLGGFGQAFNIGVTSNTPGAYSIPSFEIPLSTGTSVSEPQEIEVFPTDDITWQTLQNGEESYRIGSILLHPKGPIYAGQSIPLTGKILLPVELPVSSTGYAELEKGNIGAWRMESPSPPNYDRRVSPRPPNAVRLREVRIDGDRYQVVNYVTFAAPLAPGEVTVGPAEVKGLQILVSNQQSGGGFFSRMQRSYNLDYEIPVATFDAKPLPEGAPESFDGAIGDFELIASLDISNELKAGEPIVVQLEVSGRGNLDILKAPALQGSEASWKIYPASRNEQQGDRRSNQGAIVFSQILRPLVSTKEIPPFEFTFFNPGTSKYETLRSNPIPLNLVVSSDGSTNSPPQAGLVPIAEMSDILAIIPPQDFKARQAIRTPYWQVIPALLALFFGALIVRRHLPRLVKKDPSKGKLQSELSEIEAATDDVTFIRKAATFAEKEELPQDEFLVALLAERDASCFQPGEIATKLSSERRRDILKSLRERATRLILLGGLLIAFSGTSADASLETAEKAWEEGDYDGALANYEALAQKATTPDLLYNIGNCYYRLDQPALAALHYHRALRLDPKHPEARQNLAFINRKLGALVAPDLDAPPWTQRLPLSAITFSARLALWVIALGILARFALATSRNRRVAVATAIGGCILLLGAVLGYVFYPVADEELTIPDVLVVSQNGAEVRTEPSAAGSEILNAPPSTPATALTTRGPWTYIQLANDTRGWIRSEALSEI